MTFNWTDYALMALVLISCLLGLRRGLLREIIALLTWVAAVWIAWEYGPDLEPYLGGDLALAAVRPWAARALIFVGVLLLGTAIGAVVSHFARLSIFSGMDRFFGALFGMLRGGVIVGLLVILCHAVHLDGETWWRQSTLIPYGEHIANVLRGLVGERKILLQQTTARLSL